MRKLIILMLSVASVASAQPTHKFPPDSLTNTQVTVYLGCWDGTTGSLWWDDASIEEVAFLNMVRRPGAPLAVVGRR